MVAPGPAPRERFNARQLDAWRLDWCRREGVPEVERRTIQNRGPNALRGKSALDAALAEHTLHCCGGRSSQSGQSQVTLPFGFLWQVIRRDGDGVSALDASISVSVVCRSLSACTTAVPMYCEQISPRLASSSNLALRLTFTDEDDSRSMQSCIDDCV